MTLYFSYIGFLFAGMTIYFSYIGYLNGTQNLAFSVKVTGQYNFLLKKLNKLYDALFFLDRIFKAYTKGWTK